MPAKTSPRDSMFGSAHAHLDWAEKLVSASQTPSDADLAVARVRIALAVAWVELGREQTS